MRRFILIAPLALSLYAYEVNFLGVHDEAVLKSIYDASDLVSLQNRPPATLNALRYRAEADIPEILRVMRAYGYYDAKITPKVTTDAVTMEIDAGEEYTIGAYAIEGAHLCPEICPGDPALATAIVNAELDLLDQLSETGYPLATVKKRDIVVDMWEKQVDIATDIDTGPLAKFGKTRFEGLYNVKPAYLEKRLAWIEEEIYNSRLEEKTQTKLIDSNLFSSVLISHDEALQDGQLPMTVRVQEAKHRQISVGAFYATVDGFGGEFAWTHRNMRGLGEILSLDGEFSTRYLTGEITYKIPDFWKLNQNLIALGQIEREDIIAYTAFCYRAQATLEQRIFSIGTGYEYYDISDSARDGFFSLVSLPFQLRFIKTDDLLNPTHGYTVVYQALPYQSTESTNTHFLKQRLTGTFYIPTLKDHLILATRIQLGYIFGAPASDIPLPVLFLGGSEDDLRGYRYMTVSPLNSSNQPLGGKKAVFFSFEPRLRFGKIGIVPFTDLGKVETNWLQSVGVGLRYFTDFGPIRFDVGFPLEKREGVDKNYEFYASIGQTF